MEEKKEWPNKPKKKYLYMDKFETYQRANDTRVHGSRKTINYILVVQGVILIILGYMLCR